jgi:hypothetical protein
MIPIGNGKIAFASTRDGNRVQPREPSGFKT